MGRKKEPYALADWEPNMVSVAQQRQKARDPHPLKAKGVGNLPNSLRYNRNYRQLFYCLDGSMLRAGINVQISTPEWRKSENNSDTDH